VDPRQLAGFGLWLPFFVTGALLPLNGIHYRDRWSRG
jgi:hypothetical protein